MSSNNQEYDSELDQKIEDLQHNRVPHEEIENTLWELGKAEYQPAKPVIERFVEDRDDDIRIAALMILINRFGARDRQYWEMARDFLVDKSSFNRVEGASLLGIFASDTQDEETLRLLAPVVNNREEERGVRRAAYLAMRNIVHFDPYDSRDIIDTHFDLENKVDWELVNKYLPA